MFPIGYLEEFDITFGLFKFQDLVNQYIEEMESPEIDVLAKAFNQFDK